MRAFFPARTLLSAALALSVSQLACQLDVKLRRLPREEPITLRVSAGPDGQERTQVDSATLIEGARIFDERCAPCHGDSGQGDGALAEVLPIKPRNYHTEAFKWGARPSDIVRTVAGGRSGVMPGFAGELSPREIWSVAYVVWSWLPEENREGDPPEGPQPVHGSGGSAKAHP